MGDDFGQVVCATDKLLKKYFGDEKYYTDTFHYSDLQKDVSILRNSLQSLQLFSQKKAIIIKSAGDTIKKEMLEVIKSRNSDYLLIIQGDGLKKSSKTYKELESLNNTCLISCYKLDVRYMTIFVDKFLKSHGVRYQREIPQIIVNYLPDNVLLAQNELEKMVQYLGEEELTIEIIEKILAGVKDFSCINLCSSIVFKDQKKMLEQLRRMEGEGINYISVIRMLQNQFAKVLYVKKEEQDKKIKTDAIINNLRPPVFFKEKAILVEMCNNMSYGNAIQIMNELIQLEISCKFTSFNPNTLLYNYIIQKVE
ncbi:DNA polymerase III subunit delta [Candidatus Bandiella euplotis]|uniref:DNA polymerase III subunit delta n=1 Tax=Candidatus Bandiella euplotis TaxID=1664265 RepID=UPI003898F907